ncbi:hypothetical protein HK105_203822 [Polyrhizophydium stewartii]|uniref:Uncharacterized protein n=1 Tax=Polyrhizophydium stewartii TaxID=2732419 RepID=A0ABR4NAZ3_9FUNG|nr:hypothetical protein HK105_004686 [Polyrhizophydium stewartii]
MVPSGLVPRLVAAVDWSVGAWRTVAAAVPPALEPTLLALAENADMAVGLAIVAGMMHLFGRPLRTVHWTFVYMSGFVFAVFLGISVVYINGMANYQLQDHNARNVTTEFEPLLPLDLAVKYDYRNITRLMVLSGEKGRAAYATFLSLDTFNILNFVWFHRTLLRLLYHDEVDMTDFMISIVYRVPALYASLDLFENVASLAMLGWFEYDAQRRIPYVLTRGFIDRASLATRAKLFLVYVLFGLELTGIIKFVAERRWRRLVNGETTELRPVDVVVAELAKEKAEAEAEKKKREEAEARAAREEDGDDGDDNEADDEDDHDDDDDDDDDEDGENGQEGADRHGGEKKKSHKAKKGGKGKKKHTRKD